MAEEANNPFVEFAKTYYGWYQAFMAQTGGDVRLSRELSKDVFVAMLIVQKANANPALDALKKMWDES